MKRDLQLPALLGILALAFGLRAWGLGWGMPYAFHADEDNYLPGAMRMLTRGDLNPHYFANPPLLTYAMLAGLAAYLRLGQMMGALQSARDVSHLMLVNPIPFYLGARMIVALTGTASVLSTFLIGRRLNGGRVALAGALLLAVAFLHVRDSHYAVNDVPATFLLTISFYFVVMVATGGPETPWRHYLFGGLFLGLAVATKYNVGLGVVPLLTAHLVRLRKVGGWMDPKAHLPLAAAGLVSLLSFVAANPYSVLDYGAFTSGFAGQLRWASDPFDTSDTSVAATILRALSVGMGGAVLVFSVAGIVLMGRRRPWEAVLVGSFPVAYLAFFLLGSSLFYARFAMPLLPFFALTAGYGAVELGERLARERWRAGVTALALALMIAQPFALDVKHDYLLRQEDTRLQLGRWVEENVPPGSKIAAEGYTFVDSQGQRTGPKKLDYSLELPSSLRSRPLDFYVREGFDYLISSSYVYGRYPLDPSAHKAAIEYYRELERRFPLVAEFSPTPDGRELPFLMDDEITPIWTVMERQRPGPTIKVYRLADPPDYSVRWLTALVPQEISAGQQLSVPVSLANEGNLEWPAEGYTPVRIGYRWLDGSGQEVVSRELHSPLPRDVKPGEQVTAEVSLLAPTTPGVYTLRLDLVWENFSWLSRKGAATRDIQVLVR